MDINLLRALITPLTMLTFLAICYWAYSAKNKKRFEQDSYLPFADEEDGRQKTSGERSQ